MKTITKYYLTTNNKVVTKLNKKIVLVDMVYNDPTLCDCPVVFKTNEDAIAFANKNNLTNIKVVKVTTDIYN